MKRKIIIYLRISPGVYQYEIKNKLVYWLFRKLFVVRVQDVSFDTSQIISDSPVAAPSELRPEKVVCHLCRGRGQVRVWPSKENEQCPNCGGTGKVNKEV